MFSKLFYITKGVLQGDTLAPFVFIIVLDYVLKVTALGNFGIQTHPDKTLHDLDFADDIVLLDSSLETSIVNTSQLNMAEYDVVPNQYSSSAIAELLQLIFKNKLEH